MRAIICLTNDLPILLQRKMKSTLYSDASPSDEFILTIYKFAPEVSLRAAPEIDLLAVFFSWTYLFKFCSLILHICAVKEPVFRRGVGEVVANFTNALVTSAAKSKSRHRFTLKLHWKIFNLEKLNSILENTFGILLQKVGTSQGTGMTCFWPSPQLLFSFYVQQFEVHIWTPHQ